MREHIKRSQQGLVKRQAKKLLVSEEILYANTPSSSASSRSFFLGSFLLEFD